MIIRTNLLQIRQLLTDSPIIWRIANIFGDLQNYWRKVWRSPIILEISNSPIFLTPIWLSIKIDGSDVFEEDISEEVIEDHNNDDIIERPQDILKEHVDNDNNDDDENNNEVGNSSHDLGLKILANLKSPILLEISKMFANRFGDLHDVLEISKNIGYCRKYWRIC